MPLTFDGQQFEFQELVTYLKTHRKDIENPEAYVGTLEKEQGVDLGERFYEDEQGKWGKFFLISPNRNVNRWRVVPDSIPKRIRTFIGRPYISEPNLEHFGAENMESPLEIIQKQEEFRAGTIKNIQYDDKTGEGLAIVLFDKTPFGDRVWEDLKKGHAFYTSPAIAGEFTDVNGERIYRDWFGLHLARVAKPAFDVFHASLKATCEGDEKKCVQNLIATASKQLKSNDSLKLLGFSCANNMESNNDPSTPFEETEAGKAIAALAMEIKDMKEKVETSYEQLPNKTSEPSMKGQTTPVNDPSSDGKQSQASVAMDHEDKPEEASAAESEEMKKVKEQAQAAEDDLKERLSQDVLEAESAETDLMGETPRTAAEEETRKAELSSMDIASLKKEVSAATASLNKISAMASKFGRPNMASNFQKSRLVRQPSGTGVGTASSGSYKSTRDIKGGWM